MTTMTADHKRELRNTFIAIASRRQRPGSGTALAILKERTTRMRFPDLAPILTPLHWAVIGAVAARLYMPERVTRDLDIAVAATGGAEARRKLAEAGFAYRDGLLVGGSSWQMPDGTPLDVVEMNEPWTNEALALAQANQDGQGLPVLPLPYLALMKFQAGRAQDLADVTRMLGQADGTTLVSVRRLFAQHGPGDLNDLESLIRLGQMELN